MFPISDLPRFPPPLRFKAARKCVKSYVKSVLRDITEKHPYMKDTAP